MARGGRPDRTGVPAQALTGANTTTVDAPLLVPAGRTALPLLWRRVDVTQVMR